MTQHDYSNPDLIREQIHRQGLQRDLGQQQAEKSIRESRERLDGARTRAGKVLVETLLGTVCDALDSRINSTRAGKSKATLASIRSRLQAPELDLDSGVATGEQVLLWDTNVLVAVAYKLMVENALMPLFVRKANGKGTGRDLLKTLALTIGTRIEDELFFAYLRHHLPIGHIA